METRTCILCVHYDPETDECRFPIELGIDSAVWEVPPQVSCAFDDEKEMWYYNGRGYRAGEHGGGVRQ